MNLMEELFGKGEVDFPTFLARHKIEQEILPKLIFDDPVKMIVALANNGQEILYRMYEKLAPGKFQKEQFEAKGVRNERGGVSVAMILPKPDMPCLSLNFGATTGKDGEGTRCYTLELTADGTFFVCEIGADRTHMILASDNDGSAREQSIFLLDHLDISKPENM